MHATVPLSLDWSLLLDDGSLYPLGASRRSREPRRQVVHARGSTTATVQATCVGTCWALNGVAQLTNATVYLETDAGVTAAE